MNAQTQTLSRKRFIIKVPLTNPKYEGYITGLVKGGGKHMIDSSETAQLEGFTLFKQRMPEFNFVSCLTEEVVKITKHTTFWTQDGMAVTGQEGKDLALDVDLFALTHMLSDRRGPADPVAFYGDGKKTHIKNRIDAFLEHDNLQVLEVETTPSEIHRKHVNGRPLTFPLVDGVPQIIHKSGDDLIDTRFLWGMDPMTVPLKEFFAYDENTGEFSQDEWK